MFLKRDFLANTQRNELLLEETSEAPQSNVGTSSAPTVSTDNVPVLRRSARVPQPPRVDRPKGVKPVGYKWIYKRKIGADGEVTTFKAKFVAKGYTQRPRVNFEKTFLPVAMASFVEEEIYRDQLEGFTDSGSSVAFLVLYVDDALLIENNVKMLGETKA
ncbi:UNVERIFIED_CONTAM: hypothetical protein Slati_2900000 [Sesamum latifolium]|uniref:Reverse transcriptase Ty1/copia-type domain-containing protein n=1 Tax=Sesamum latifolium TaxID=2727402 RepID=A0AAW2VDH7_9LAMI